MLFLLSKLFINKILCMDAKRQKKNVSIDKVKEVKIKTARKLGEGSCFCNVETSLPSYVSTMSIVC